MGFKNNFNIEITEIRHLDIAIEAETEKEALGKYVIDNKDIVAAEFEVIDDANSNEK